MNDELLTYISQLTNKPGIYKMLDDQGKVLYVGKATNLKNRVRSYFNRQQTNSKTLSLVGQIRRIEVIVTKSETEALLLESNLIKALRPKYNVLLRDDKTYPYVFVSNHAFPRMELYRTKKKPTKGLYFGPFPSAGLVRETISILQKVFKIRNCKDNFFNLRTRPCLQYQINRCTAPCVQYITEEAYQKSVQDAVQFLQGKSKTILNELTQKMEKAGQDFAFEEAAFIRDQIKNLRSLQERQRVTQLNGDADVVVLKWEASLAIVLCVTVREGQVIASNAYFPTVPKESLPDENLEEQILKAFVSHYYLDMPEHIPPLLILDRAYPNAASLQSLLKEIRQKAFKIEISPQGKKTNWIQFAKTNLDLAFEQEANKTVYQAKRYELLRTFLGLENPITRMECFDISHSLGQAPVASCVVFDEMGAKKSDYRQFNIQNITPGDDYAAIEQAVLRRYQRLIEENQTCPDLLIIDGGKGQVAAAQKALATLNCNTMTLIGIAKGVERKRGLERLILVSAQEEYQLPEDSPVLHLLQQIRDEAHRFAVKRHRAKRQKEAMASSLDHIEGIGPKRKQALLRHFGGLQKLKIASVEELVKVHGISKPLALKIMDALRSR